MPVYYPGIAVRGPGDDADAARGRGARRRRFSRWRWFPRREWRARSRVLTGPSLPTPASICVRTIARRAAARFEGFRTTRAGPEGRFQFADVPPGAYTLAARAALPPPAGTARPGVTAPILWASTEVSVEGQSLSGVSLMLQPGLSVTGSVRFDGASAVPADFSGARVSLAPMPGGQIAITAGAATVDATGRFTISGVSPGRYRVNATFTSARAWIYRSTSVGGEGRDRPAHRDSRHGGGSDRHVHGSSGAARRQGRRPQPARRRVTQSSSCSRRIPTAWYSQSRRIRSISLQTLTAATPSRACFPETISWSAVDDVEPGEWFDPAFLQRLVPAATKITIAEGEKKVQDVRVGGG